MSVTVFGSLIGVWNSDAMKMLRREFLSGNLPSVCKKCIVQEQNGIASKRILKNKHYPKWALSPEKLIAATEKDGTLNIAPRSFELRPGNLCNLICITCSPEYSTKWKKKSAAIHALDNNAAAGIREISEEFTPDRMSWAEQLKLFEYFERNINSIGHISFSGGEPLLMKLHRNIIDLCISSGYAKKIHLSYDTHALLLDSDWIDRWDKVMQVPRQSKP